MVVIAIALHCIRLIHVLFLLFTHFVLFRSDPEFLMHLAQHAEDSTRIVIQQCDGQECREIYGVRDHLGWTFDGGLAGDWKQTTLRVVSRYGEDCE